MIRKGGITVTEPDPIRVGLDLVLISRVKKSYEKRPCLFIKRFFSKDEAAYCLSASGPRRKLECLAGRIAAKEAVMKVLGRGWPQVPWTDIEILHDDLKRPFARLRGKALSFMEELNLGCIQISITHDGQIAAAVAVGVSR